MCQIRWFYSHKSSPWLQRETWQTTRWTPTNHTTFPPQVWLVWYNLRMTVNMITDSLKWNKTSFLSCFALLLHKRALCSPMGLCHWTHRRSCQTRQERAKKFWHARLFVLTSWDIPDAASGVFHYDTRHRIKQVNVFLVHDVARLSGRIIIRLISCSLIVEQSEI